MPDVQTPEPGQKLARRYGIKGQIIVPSLESIVVPVAIVDDLSEEEPRGLFCTATSTVAGVAGVLSQSALALPTGSGTLLENVKLTVSVVTTTGVSVSQTGPALSNGVTPIWQDQRRAGTPEALVTHGTDAGATGTIWARIRLLAHTPYTFDFGDAIIDLNGKLHVLVIDVNIELRYWWRWSERLETAEEEF